MEMTSKIITQTQHFIYFEVNIEGRGLKSSLEGSNEAQKLELRLKMR
jgi:hypothetical protein